MEWILPKTGWNADSRMNTVDYNRIKNNLQTLSDLVNEVYCPISLENMGADKGFTDWFYAREFNVFERNVDFINQMAFFEDIGVMKTFFDNGPFIDYEELNRIESAMLVFFNKAAAQKKTLPRLALTLGGAKGVKV
ncbi:MAG: hypothetical protein Q4C58_14220 [Eubacteriales bacterium]|nr:hypothetical protein [Eubacteriales bacterium]